MFKRAGGAKQNTMSKADMAGILEALGRSQAVIEFKPDGTILTANENFLSALGYSLGEIEGQHHRMFVVPEYANTQSYKEFWAALARGEFQSAQFVRLAKGGRKIWIQASYNPILDKKGAVKKVIKYATDVTEDVLRNADYEGQINAIGTSQAVIEFDLNGKILTSNKNFQEAVGYSLDEMVGQHHSMFVDADYAHSADYRAFWDALSKGEFRGGEYRRLHKSGETIWIHATYNPIFDPDGEPYKVVKYASYITEKVEAQKRMTELSKALAEHLTTIKSSVTKATEDATAASGSSKNTIETVHSVAAATEQFQASAQEIAQSMVVSKREVDTAMHEAKSADSSVMKLAESAQSMNTVVEVIQSIADKINLLALNATIEAARAGEAGKGFAVVASEVKSLAAQVGKATEEISTDISGIQSVSQNVVKALGSITKAVETVETSISSVVSAVEEQSAMSQEVAQNMQVATQAVQGIDSGLGMIETSITEADTLATDAEEIVIKLSQIAA